MSERFILEALQTSVTQAVRQSLESDLAVKYVGLTHDIDTTTRWLEIVYIPNNDVGRYWNEGKIFRGIMRLILHNPKSAEGVYDEIDLITSILDYFQKDTKLADPNGNVTVQITDQPTVLDLIEEESEFIIPASIRYRFFKS